MRNLVVFHASMWDATGNGGGAVLNENFGRQAWAARAFQILEFCMLGREVVFVSLEATLGY